VQTEHEARGPLEGVVKPWLESRLGLIGALIYDAATAAVLLVLLKALDGLSHWLKADGFVSEALVFVSHWLSVVMFSIFAIVDALAHVVTKGRTILEQLKRPK